MRSDRVPAVTPNSGCADSTSSDTTIGMAQLSLPTVRVRRSFLAAMAEFRGEGRGTDGDRTMIGDEIREFGRAWSCTPDGFADYVQALRAQAREASPRPDGYVPATTMWWVTEEEYLGRIAVRHRLTPHLREVGGHIGYDVRPSARRRGHATAMLRAALPIARSLGLESALVTCDVDNIASRKVIERNGGVLQDQRGDKLRFWVPTSG
jgi:predicted acetyltransferase